MSIARRRGSGYSILAEKQSEPCGRYEPSAKGNSLSINAHAVGTTIPPLPPTRNQKTFGKGRYTMPMYYMNFNY